MSTHEMTLVSLLDTFMAIIHEAPKKARLDGNSF